MRKPISLTLLLFAFVVSGCAASTKTVKTAPASELPVPVAEREVVAKAPVIAAKPNMPAASFKYDQLTNLISEFLEIKSGEGESGEPVFLGTSENNLVTLEMVGGKDEISVASMKLIYPKDIEAVNRDLNNAMILRFLRNVAPEIQEWSEKIKNIVNNFYALQIGEVKEDVISLEDKTIKIISDNDTSSITVMARPSI